MSTRKGGSKKKGQKYQNSFAFKNDLHDTSKTTKAINGLVVVGVCDRCRGIIEWRKKFKKYKPLTAPKKCVKCEKKTVKHAYHTICVNCALQLDVCEKCGCKSDGIARSRGSDAEQAEQGSKLHEEIKFLTERQRRTFFRAFENGTLTGNLEATEENKDSDENGDDSDDEA